MNGSSSDLTEEASRYAIVIVSLPGAMPASRVSMADAGDHGLRCLQDVIEPLICYFPV
jgi:hypothetical protein